MPKEKKAKVDTEGLGRLMGIYAYVNGGVWIAMGMFHALGIQGAQKPAIMFFVVSTLCMLIKAKSMTGIFMMKTEKLRKEAGKQFLLPAALSVVILILVAVLVFFSTRSTKATFLEEGLEIHGMYGGVYTWESIESAALMERLPTIEMRTNGSALGPYLKGHFRTTELGPVKLFVDTQDPPFIYLETEKGVIILNMKDRDETQEIFDIIKRETK